MKAVEDAEEPDCAGVAEESTELCDEDANEPQMEKADAKVPRVATQTAVDKIICYICTKFSVYRGRLC